MTNLKYIFIVLLVVTCTTNKIFAQSLSERLEDIFFNKKNSLTYQNGILNYFYDERPVIVNLPNLKYVSNPFHFANSVLIKSRGLNYTRRFKNQSNITLVGSHFKGAYSKNGSLKDNSLFPVVTYRIWHFVGLEYNRLLLEKSKLKLFYGAGLNFRKGFEYYKILQITTSGGWGESFHGGSRVQNIGATLNLNMRYDFWKRFFFHQ